MDTFRECRVCHAVLLLNDRFFYRQTPGSNNFYHTCRECSKAKARARNKARRAKESIAKVRGVVVPFDELLINWTAIDMREHKPHSELIAWTETAIYCAQTNRDCKNCVFNRLGYEFRGAKTCHVPYYVQALVEQQMPVPKRLLEAASA